MKNFKVFVLICVVVVGITGLCGCSNREKLRREREALEDDIRRNEIMINVLESMKD